MRPSRAKWRRPSLRAGRADLSTESRPPDDEHRTVVVLAQATGPAGVKNQMIFAGSPETASIQKSNLKLTFVQVTGHQEQDLSALARSAARLARFPRTPTGDTTDFATSVPARESLRFCVQGVGRDSRTHAGDERHAQDFAITASETGVTGLQHTWRASCVPRSEPDPQNPRAQSLSIPQVVSTARVPL